MTTSAETASIYGVVKSGWLHRQSDFLRRWKRSFCVIHTDGRFVYYTDESQRESEGNLNLRNCYAIKVGHQVGQTPPSNHSTESLFEVKTPENIIVFCADSSDDAQAWKTSMMEAKQANNPTISTTYTTQHYGNAPPAYAEMPPPYSPVAQTVTTTTYPNGQQQVVVQRNGPGAHNGVYPVQTAAYSYPGQTVYTTYGAPPAAGTVRGTNHHQTIIYQQQPRRDNIGDATLGLAAGAAVGSMMMMPLLFW